MDFGILGLRLRVKPAIPISSISPIVSSSLRGQDTKMMYPGFRYGSGGDYVTEYPLNSYRHGGQLKKL